VDRIEQPGPSRHIVDAVIRLAHGLSAKVVAEGVETRGQLQALAALGCDLAQGYLLSEPVPPQALPALCGKGATQAGATPRVAA
jgi:EAL domain-containing protein (putative c-di-GMP-specific phosphodiesterase class I)